MALPRNNKFSVNPPEKNPFFCLTDLQRLELRVEVRNSTSGIELASGSTQLIEVRMDGVDLDVPLRSCAIGHSLGLVFLPIAPVPENSIAGKAMQMTATVEKLSPEMGDRQQAQLRFRQFARAPWEELLEYWARRQDSLNTLIRRTRS